MKIVITNEGMKISGEYDSNELVAYLTEALVVTWAKEIGMLDPTLAGRKVIDALHDAEMELKVNKVYKMLEDAEDDE